MMKDMVQTAPARLGDKRQPDRRTAREQDIDGAVLAAARERFGDDLGEWKRRCRELLLDSSNVWLSGRDMAMVCGQWRRILSDRLVVSQAARTLACANRKPSKRAQVHAELAKAVAR